MLAALIFDFYVGVNPLRVEFGLVDIGVRLFRWVYGLVC